MLGSGAWEGARIYMMKTTRRLKREPCTEERTIPISIVTIDELARQEVRVRCVDVNDDGLGIVSDIPLQPGLVWFPAGIREQRSGLVLWSKEIAGKHRAGVRFMPLPDLPQEAPSLPPRAAYPPALQDPWVLTPLLIDKVYDYERPEEGPHYDLLTGGIDMHKERKPL